MFNFKKAKKIVKDWANDVSDNNDRMIEVLSKILVPLSDITKYWENDFAYMESNRKALLIKTDLYTFGNIIEFLKYYNSEDFQKKVSEYQRLEYSNNESILKAIQYYCKLANLIITNEQEFKIFINRLIDLDIALQTSNEIKKNIIIANYIAIFYDCKMINLIRSQNEVYLTLIGKYDNVENILGKDGIKLKDGDDTSIRYIFNLEKLKDYLESKKDNLELEQQIRKN